MRPPPNSRKLKHGQPCLQAQKVRSIVLSAVPLAKFMRDSANIIAIPAPVRRRAARSQEPERAPAAISPITSSRQGESLSPSTRKWHTLSPQATLPYPDEESLARALDSASELRLGPAADTISTAASPDRPEWIQPRTPPQGSSGRRGIRRPKQSHHLPSSTTPSFRMAQRSTPMHSSPLVPRTVHHGEASSDWGGGDDEVGAPVPPGITPQLSTVPEVSNDGAAPLPAAPSVTGPAQRPARPQHAGTAALLDGAVRPIPSPGRATLVQDMTAHLLAQCGPDPPAAPRSAPSSPGLACASAVQHEQLRTSAQLRQLEVAGPGAPLPAVQATKQGLAEGAAIVAAQREAERREAERREAERREAERREAERREAERREAERLEAERLEAERREAERREAERPEAGAAAATPASSSQTASTATAPEFDLAALRRAYLEQKATTKRHFGSEFDTGYADEDNYPREERLFEQATLARNALTSEAASVDDYVRKMKRAYEELGSCYSSDPGVVAAARNALLGSIVDAMVVGRSPVGDTYSIAQDFAKDAASARVIMRLADDVPGVLEMALGCIVDLVPELAGSSRPADEPLPCTTPQGETDHLFLQVGALAVLGSMVGAADRSKPPQEALVTMAWKLAVRCTKSSFQCSIGDGVVLFAPLLWMLWSRAGIKLRERFPRSAPRLWAALHEQWLAPASATDASCRLLHAIPQDRHPQAVFFLHKLQGKLLADRAHGYAHAVPCQEQDGGAHSA